MIAPGENKTRTRIDRASREGLKRRQMISVVIPTLDDEARLATTLAPLVSAAIHGLVTEVIVADGGSTDATLALADDTGARVVPAEADIGRRLAAGCLAAKGQWLLVLPPGVRLEAGWEAAAEAHIDKAPAKAGYFRVVLEGQGTRLREHLAGWRVALTGRSYFEQGLLVSRRLYDETGGYRAKDDPTELIGRVGRGRLARLAARVFVPV
jgi:glycosyltransferase involved in cell wall biosynthesis